MIRLLTTLTLIIVSLGATSKTTIDFSVPASLKKNADVVVLFDNTHYIRKSKTRLIEKKRVAYTILNRRAKGYEQMMINYDGLSKINQFSCTIYDRNGKVSKKIKKSEIMDFSHYSDFTMYSDNRVKVASCLHQSYPYTIVFEYEKEYDGFFILSPWRPGYDYRLAVKETSLTIETPKDQPFVYETVFEEELTKDETEREGLLSQKWSMRNVKAREHEEFSPYLSHQLPQIYFAPKMFEYDGYSGSNASWNDLGRFCHSLFHEENELTDQTKIDLDAIKAKAANDKELIRLIYEYMQSKTRYVGVQLGIGGWQPFPSLSVDENGYGDCKALSYYTKTLLDYVGISSNFTVIGSGSKEIRFDSFPANQTNHAILCVPNAGDTIWLECTSQIMPFNYLSNSCTNRRALLIDEKQSTIVYVPQRTKNIRTRESRMSVKEDGTLICSNTLNYSGSFFDSKYYLYKYSKKELKEYLQKSTPVSDIKINDYAVAINKDSATLTVNNNFEASGLASKAGDRFFVDLSPFAQANTYKKQRTERQNDIILRDNKTYKDRIYLSIPEGYQVEFLPEDHDDASDYADYSFKVTEEDDQIIVNRIFSVKAGTYPKENYEGFIDFFNKLANMDRCKVSFKKI